MFVASDGSSPSVRLPTSTVPSQTIREFGAPSRNLPPSVRQLSDFLFLYLARVDSPFDKPKNFFNSLVDLPPDRTYRGPLRYFKIPDGDRQPVLVSDRLTVFSVLRPKR